METARVVNSFTDPERTPPSAFRLAHRPCLDGLRGVAILCVLVSHWSHIGGSFGFVGVDLFFVLSGFLITCLLLEERRETGRINLGAFYARRALRLLPALLALLVAYLTYGALVHSHKDFLLDLKHALTALFYSMNWAMAYYRENIVFLRHTWSLSIEEQFYLLWPATLLCLLMTVRRTSILSCALLGCFLSWLSRCLLFLGTTADASRLYAGLDTRADALLLGCSLAALLTFGRPPASNAWDLALRYGSFLAVAVLVLFSVAFEIFTPFMYLAGWFLITLSCGALLLELMSARNSPVRRVVENPVLRYLGKISYGLYLWHWPVLAAVRELAPAWPRWQCVFASAGVSFGLTLLSYYYLEQPCLELKRRFQKVQPAGLLAGVPQPSPVTFTLAAAFQSPDDFLFLGSE